MKNIEPVIASFEEQSSGRTEKCSDDWYGLRGWEVLMSGSH